MNLSPENFLIKYLNNPSPTGFELEGQKIWMNYLQPYVDEFITDAYGTAVGVINPGQDYKVVLEAHADEIAWYVNYINPEGFIYVKRNGGSDHMIAPAKRVNIFTENGIVKGVFGWPAIHTRKNSKEEVPKLSNIFIDVGAKNAKEVRQMGIFPGTVITFEDELTVLNDRFYTGRALDNRIGGYMVAQVGRKLFEAKHRPPYTLYLVNSVQEEVGLRGAHMIAHRLKPDVAVVTDVTHDTTTPMVDKVEQGDIRAGRGPVITVAPSVHNKLRRFISQLAHDKEINFQHDSASRSTGTDTDAFAYSNVGVPSALISLPLRYMHTTVEMCHKDDVELTINLMLEFVKSLQKDQKFSYFDE
ncbi:MAG TPA: M42 family peptidase [Bacteroidetes bacterium]|nr:M42 family peptidase [Bacteroidota bacterium]